MNLENKQTLIFIKQKNRTDDVLSIKPGIDGKIKVRYTNNKEYSYNKEDVEEYQFLEKLPVENYKFSRSGYGAYNNVISVEKYSYLEKNKIKVCFEHGKNVILNQENFKIEQSALFEKKANDVFEYLKKLANLNNIKSDDGSSLLGKNYERVTFVSQQSVLHRFLSASSTKVESESKSDDQSLIFPFGCNNSQLIATERALKNQISFIEGPPGTGKTQTILNILSNIIYRNQTALVVSNNNSAIANIKEKLSQPEIALDFLTATLGSKKNKEKFLKNQSSHYPNYLPDILENKERNLNFELVKKAFSLKEEIANIKSQISFIEIEYQHFQDYMSDKDLFEVDLSKLSPKVLLDLLLECEKIFEQNRKIGFIFKIKSIFKYKIRNFSFYKQNPDFLAATIQKKFYETELEKLNKKLSKLENDYKTNLSDEYIANMIEYSKSILKSALLEKYIPGAPRKVNNTDNSAKNRLNLSKKILKDYPIILSTTFSARNCVADSMLYDYLIIDEASQVDIATGALALSCAKNVVIVGDLKQLPNIVTRESKEKSECLRKDLKIKPIYSFKKSLLEVMVELFPEEPATLLKEHYRCHPKIIQFCNQKLYNGKLCIMTKDHGEKDVLIAYKSVAGNHARQHSNQREIDIIKKEVIDYYLLDNNTTGIIAPYRNQIELSQNQLEEYISETVHKFQGRECETIILSTVDNQITHFTDDPHLLNVAVSRAKNRLILVTSGNKQKSNMNITDLIDYIAYQNCDIKDSMVRSVFDYLYKQYEERRLNYFKNRSKHSKYDSENLMFELLKEILTSYSELDFITQYRLKHLIKDFSLLSSDEATFVNQSRTSVDFLIFNKVTKVPVLAIEVDGVKYHNNPDQMKRDSMKNNIFKNYQLPLLRLATNGSGEEEKIRIALADYKSTDEIIQSKDMINNI